MIPASIKPKGSNETKIFHLGQATLKDPQGIFHIYFVGGIWGADCIRRISIYLSLFRTEQPKKDGTLLISGITIERDDHSGAFTNQSGVPKPIRILIKNSTETLFAK